MVVWTEHPSTEESEDTKGLFGRPSFMCCERKQTGIKDDSVVLE